MADIITTVDMGNIKDLSALLGVLDENLNIIARETGITAFVDGTKIKLSGSEDNVRLAETVVEKLGDIVKAGEPIDKTRIIYCVELAKEGNAAGIEKIMSGVVAITSRGKQIKCKTVGQKKYVDAIKKIRSCSASVPRERARLILRSRLRYRRSRIKKSKRLF